MNKNIKKNIVKVAVIAMTLVIGTATITYAKHTVRKTEKEVASEDINSAENKLKHKAIKKSINEEADKAIQFSEEKMENIRDSVEMAYNNNNEENAKEAEEKGVTEEELLEEKVDSRVAMLKRAEYTAKSIISIIEGEITVDDEYIMELARKIRNREDTDGSLMYEIYNAYKDYLYNNCDEEIIEEAKEELQEEMKEH